MSTFKTLACSALAAVIGIGAASAAFAADDLAKFYKGKRIKIIVGSGPGGGYDTYARMIARHMGRHIPGKPGFIVQNKDGAGSIVAMNFVQNVLPKDGTVIAGLQRNLALVEIMGQPGPKFKAQDINWLGSLANEAGVCAIATRTGIKSFAEVFTREFVMGGTGPNDTEIAPALFNNLLGAKFKLIRGYPSTPPVHLAIQRGEVDGICQSWASFSEQAGPFLREGKIKALVQMSLKPNPEMQKLGAPMVFDFVTPERVQPGFTVDDVNGFFRLVFAAKAMGRPFAMAAGVPADRVKAMRAAFIATANDPRFLAEAKKLKRDVELVTGDEIQDIVAKMAATPKDKLAKLDDLMKFKGKAAKAEVELARHTGKVTALKGGGRSIVIDYKGKNVTAKVSGSRTKLTLNGKSAKRSAVKVGMTCTFVYPGPGSEAKEIHCEG